MTQLKQQARGVTIQALLLISVCIGLIFVDNRYNHLEVVRSNISVLLSPLRYFVSLPALGSHWVSEWFTSHTVLLDENESLRARGRILHAKLQKMQVLQAENIRLRRLLGASRKLTDKVIVAELLSVDQNPYRQFIEINKGTGDGIEIDQAIIDDFGIMGQVTHINHYSSTIILISDPSHVIPVQFIRSGVRSIAYGNGNTDHLELRFLPTTADIQIGDELVTSGLGGRFPADYPVATVVSVSENLTQGFASVLVAPKARLDSSREVLVIKIDDLEADK